MPDWRSPLPLRILVIGDFGATAEAGPLRVTVESYEEVLARMAPRAELRVSDRLGAGGEHELSLDLSSTAGFHPDALVEALPPLASAVDRRETTAAEEPAPERDRELGAQLDEILHHPALQQVESAWRGLRLLLQDAPPPAVAVEVLSVARDRLVETFREQVFEPEYRGAEVPLAAVLLDFDFDHRTPRMAQLEAMGELARALQVVLVAGTGPQLFGLKSLVHLTALTDLGRRLAAPVYQRLRKFQTSEAARWTALTLNRVLLRNLYEPGVGGVTKLPYRESADGAHPERYLFGRAIWLVGANLARSFSAHGHCAEISGHGGLPFHQGLPVRSVSAAERDGWTSVEVPLNEPQAQDLTRLGLTTLVGQVHGNFAYFPFVTNLFRPRPGRLTVETALSHQLFAGHVSHHALQLLGSLPAGSGDEAAASHFRNGFLSLLGPAGEGATVQVEVGAREEAGRTARIRIVPAFTIREKEVDLSFELPLG